MKRILFCIFCTIANIAIAQNSGNTTWWKKYTNIKNTTRTTNVPKKNAVRKKTNNKTTIEDYTPPVEIEEILESNNVEPQIEEVFVEVPVVSSPIIEPTILYYDSNWKGVPNETFASYYRILSENADSNFRNRYRDYYITGELQGEGEYVSIDKYDDTNSIFSGEHVSYFKSGKIETKGYFDNGIPVGEYKSYYESGLMKTHVNYSDGKFNGIYTEFNEAGDMCMQVEYEYGTPKYDYYTLSNKDGYALKMKLSDNSQIWESPNESEKKVQYKDGVTWPYYVKNGLIIAISNSKVKDYGKYYKIPVIVTNHSLIPIVIDPSDIQAELTDKKGRNTMLNVLSADEYSQKIKNRQNWNKFFVGLAEGLAAANAGYSTSTTNTNTTYSGYANSNYNALAIGSRGYAYGHGSKNSYWGGNSSTSSKTVTYDGAAAYQAQIIASERTAAYSNALDEQREIREAGYLKKTTINPGETVSGYVNVEMKKGITLTISICINQAIYKFVWDVK